MSITATVPIQGSTLANTARDPRALQFDHGRIASPYELALPCPARDHRAPAVTSVVVGDIMATPPLTSAPDASVDEIAHRIITLGQHEIVVVTGRQPLGVVTARRLLALLHVDPARWRPNCAMDFVPPRVPVVHPDLDVHAAASIMTRQAVETLPVVDLDGALLGVVAQRHLVRELGRNSPQRR